MATWRVSFDDPLMRDIAQQQEGKDAAYWQQTMQQRVKPAPSDAMGIRALVEHLAPSYGVDPAFATAIARTESNFQPSVVSSAGAQGVMQLMPATAKRFGVRDSFDPEQNIRGGLQYLSLLQQMFPGRRDLQMAAYNAGEGAVKKYGNVVPPYPETHEYVRRVTNAMGASLPPHQQAAMMQIRQDLGMAPAANEPQPTGPHPFLPPRRPREATEEPRSLPEVATAAPPTPAATPIAGGETAQAPPLIPEEPWTPARKPIEKGLMLAGMGGGSLSQMAQTTGTALASIGTGFTKGVASMLEAPTAALRMAGVGGAELSPFEKMASWLRETVVKPMEPLQAEQPKPLIDIMEGLGQAGTFLAPGMAVEGAAAKIAANAPRIAALFGATASGVLQGTVAMNDTYHALTPLLGEDEAGKRAQTAFVANTLLGAAGSQLGIFNKWVPEGLSRVVAAAVAQGGQGAIQYEANRRLFWVPGDSEQAPALLQMGWERQGDRVVQPYRVKDQLEAALINAVVGGVFGAAQEYASLPIPEALKPFEKDPGFTVERAVQAAFAPETPPADVPFELWQRWAHGVLDLLPTAQEGVRAGVVRQILGNEPPSPERRALLEQRRQANARLNILDDGGPAAQALAEELGVATPDDAHTLLQQQITQVNEALAQLPPPAPVLPPRQEPVAPEPGLETPPAPPPPGGVPLATGGEAAAVPSRAAAASTEPRAPTLREGAEGVPVDRFRTEAGRWRIPLRDMPPQELELQDFIRQQGGINLRNETDVQGELRALISPRETGTMGLQNSRTGLSLQQMAERAQEHGFLGTADKESLLRALDRSVGAGQNVYSVYATGRVPVLDNPHVEAAYRHVRKVIETLEARTVEQTRGTRPHAQVISEAEARHAEGSPILDYMRDIVAPTTMDDTSLVEMMIGMARLGEQLQAAAQRVVETGGRPGSPEVQDYLTIKALFGELLPVLSGVRAEVGRALSILNEPMSGHNRYLNELRKNMLEQGEGSVLQMARQDLGVLTAGERAAAEAAAKLPATGERAQALFAELEQRIQAMQHEPFPQQFQQELYNRLKEEFPATDWNKVRAQIDRAFSHEPFPHQVQLPLYDRLQQEFPATDWNAVAAQIEKAFGHEPFPAQTERLLLHRPEGREPTLQERVRATTTEAGTPLQMPTAREVAAAQLRETGVEVTPAQLASIQANLGQARPGLAGVITELNSAAMLGPQTWVANAVANTAMGIYSIPTRMLAAAISPLRRGAEALLGRTPEPGVYAGEAGELLFGAYRGFMESLVAANRMRATGESAFDTQDKFSSYAPAVTAENFHLDPGSPLGKFVDFYGEWVGLLSGGRKGFQVLSTTDEFYLSMGYLMERNALAYAEARAQGLEGVPYAERMAQVMSDPDVAERIHAQSLEAAKYQTLRTEPPDSGLAKFIPWIANQTIPLGGDFWNNLPIGRLLIPFHMVASNSARMTMDNTPLALFTKRFYQAMNAGGRQADMALGRMLTGTLMTTALAGLVGSMALTGRAPQDPMLRETWLKDHPEYSAYLPGVGWVEYKRLLGPIGNAVAITADAAQLMGELEGDMASKVAAAAWMAIDRNIWDETAGRSISDLFEAMQPRKGEDAGSIIGGAQRFLTRQAAPVVGRFATGGLSQSWTARAVVSIEDPELKYAQGFLDQIYAVTPGWSHDVPRRRSHISGEPELFGYGVGPDTLKALERGFFPAKIQDQELSAADRAILDNDMRLQKIPDHLDADALQVGQQASSDLATLKGLTTRKLTPAEHERLIVLSALNEEAAKTVYATDQRIIPAQTMQLATMSAAIAAQAAANQFGGTVLTPPKAAMSLPEMLNWLVTTPAFAAGSPGQGGGREAAVQAAVQQYRQYGRNLFLELEPEIGGQHAQTQIQHQIQRYPEGQRDMMRLMLEQGYVASRPATRQILGLPPLPIGAP